MRSRIAKSLLVTVSLFTAGLSQPTVSRAGIIADTWWAIFGPAGTPYFPGARASYYGGYGYASYYRGRCCPPARPVRVYYQPSTCCQPCNPCGTSTACPGGPCRISDSADGPSTFKNDGNPPTPMKDSNFKSRKESGEKTFKPTRKPGEEGDNGEKKKDENNNGTATKREALKPPTPATKEGENKKPDAEKQKTEGDGKNGPVIRTKKPAPAKAPVGPNTANGEQQATVGMPFDRVTFDSQVTWRTPMRRTRLVIRPVLPTTTVSRGSFPLNEGWKPVRPTESRLVRK